MYLALNSKGLTLETYLIYMSSLVRLGLLTQGGDCYRITDKGRDYIRKALSTTEMASDKV
jgi:predicted transcriptional regulator